MQKQLGNIVVNGETINVQVTDLDNGLQSLMTSVAAPQTVRTIRLILPAPHVVRALLSLDASLPAAQTLFDAIAIGLCVEVVMHQQLLPMLDVDALMPLPIKISDQQGTPVYAIDSSVINYSDVALLDHCWLLTLPSPIFTQLAIEHMQRNHILHITKRGGCTHAIGKNSWLRCRHSKN